MCQPLIAPFKVARKVYRAKKVARYLGLRHMRMSCEAE
jgi:hypothetical protein